MEEEEFYELLADATNEYQKLLKKEFEIRWKSIPIDLTKSAEYEVIWGIVSRQVSLVYQMSISPYTWNELFLPIVMRCMVENYINLCWILQESDKRSKMYIDYGLGRETKLLEYAKAKEHKKQIDLNYIQATEAWINQQRFIHLNKINVGNWKIWGFNDVRKTAQAAHEKDYYDRFYDVCSSATHSTWNYIAKHNLKKCNNPLHKEHRVPIIKEPEIEISMFLILVKILQDTFDKIDAELEINLEVESSLDYIISRFRNESSEEE